MTASLIYNDVEECKPNCKAQVVDLVAKITKQLTNFVTPIVDSCMKEPKEEACAKASLALTTEVATMADKIKDAVIDSSGTANGIIVVGIVTQLVPPIETVIDACK